MLNYVNNYQTEYLTAIKDSIVTYLNDQFTNYTKNISIINSGGLNEYINRR